MRKISAAGVKEFRLNSAKSLKRYSATTVAYLLNDGPWELWPIDMFKDEFAKAFEERIFPSSYFLTYTHTTWVRYQLSKRYIRENEDHPFLPLQNYVEQFCVENKIAFQDLFDSFIGHNHVDLWAHPTDQHPNAKGHRIIAEALKESIQQRQFLD